MKTNFSRIVALSIAVFLCMGLGTSAHAILLGVGGNPPVEFGTEHIDIPIQVGTDTDPIDIDIDPTGPDWVKDFFINITETGIDTGWGVQVSERIRLGAGGLVGVPPQGMADWHESIIGGENGENFEWAPGGTIRIDGGDPISGNLSDNNKTLDFFFPVVYPDFDNLVELQIEKTLIWTGPPISATTGGTNFLHVQIQQNPSIPEPSTLVLLGAMGAGLLVHRRR